MRRNDAGGSRDGRFHDGGQRTWICGAKGYTGYRPADCALKERLVAQAGGAYKGGIAGGAQLVPNDADAGYEALAKAVADAEFRASAGEQARKALFRNYTLGAQKSHRRQELARVESHLATSNDHLSLAHVE
jgi:hypothetical protein